MKPWLWVLIAAVLALAAAFVLRRRGGRGHRSHRGQDVRNYVDERHGDSTGVQLGSLTRKVSDVEKGLDRHSREVQALRTDVWQRLDVLERRLAEAERRTTSPPRERPYSEPPPSREQPQPASYGAGYEEETYGTMLRDPAPWANPGVSGRPVEVRDGVLIVSHSLPPAAYAVPEGQGRAKVYLNDSVEINEFALPKWEAFFDMLGARPYATYRTVRPAEVSWDAAAERGSPLTMGVAEAV